MSGPPDISVVIPVYNEAAIVRDAALALDAALEARGRNFEIILSENGSTDGTLGILESLTRGHPRIRYLHSDVPDYGFALRRGILEAKGRYVFCDEIDLCDPDFHDLAFELLEQDVGDMIIGSKAAPGATDRRPPIRRLATRVLNGMLRVSLGFSGTDTHGLKAFHRLRLLPVVERCTVGRDLFASELVIRAEKMGLTVVEVPVDIVEKRPPSVHLLRRVPGVLKGMGTLIWVIRLKRDA